MLDEVVCNIVKQIIISNNSLKIGYSLLTGFDLMLIAAFLETLFVILFNLLNLLTIKDSFGRASVIDKPNSNAIPYGVSHGVLIYDISEDFHGCIDRCARKTDVCCIRESCMKKLGKSIACNDFCFLYHKLLVKVVLSAVCFIRDTDDVAAVTDFTELLCKLLNCSQINTTAGNLSKHGLKLFP